MAVIRNTAAMRLRGKVGNTTYYTQGRRQIARVSENSSNYGEDARRSPAQQARRVKWANLVQFYRHAASVLEGSFETKTAAQSNYNKFMAKNLSSARINLTKEQAERGCCVMDTFIISEGSLPQVTLTLGENIIVSSIPIVATSQGKLSTVANLYSAIKGAWPQLEEGTQITLVITGSDGEDVNFPHIEFMARELTLSGNDTSTIESHFGLIELHANNGHLEFHGLSPDGYYGVILSNSVGGSLRTSTCVLTPGDTSLAQLYASREKELLAIASYGVDTERYLDSGSAPIQ